MRHYYTGREAALGWAAVVSVIAAYELVAPEGQLLSEGIDRALIRWPIATRITVAVVALHLLNLIPARIDPLHRLVSLRGLPMQAAVKRRSALRSGAAREVWA